MSESKLEAIECETLERKLSDLLSKLLSERVFAIRSEKDSIFDPDLAWSYYKLQNGNVFGLTIIHSSLKECDWSARGWNKSELEHLGFCFCESFGDTPPNMQSSYSLHRLSDPCAVIGLIRVAGLYSEDLAVAPLASPSSQKLLKLIPDMKLEISSTVTLTSRSTEEEYLAKIEKALIHGKGLEPQPISLSFTEGRAEINVLMEKHMNTQSQNSTLCATLRLGSIALPVEEVLSLRPGSELSFDCPSPLLGVLEIGGSDWLRVQLEIEENSIRLKVLEFDRETFPTNARLDD